MNTRIVSRKKSHTSQLIFILIILFSVISVNILLIVSGLVSYSAGEDFSRSVLVFFALCSFGVTLFISGYHVSTMFGRNRRRTDTRQE
ncbi:MAG: hypothetical protein LBH97_06325 [Treponema sp.]|nr:hypothetical protein [Treponema sp.]